MDNFTEECMAEVRATLARIEDKLDVLLFGASPYTPPQLPIPDTVTGPHKCPKCGISLAGVTGYVCSQSDCPTGLGPTIC